MLHGSRMAKLRRMQINLFKANDMSTKHLTACSPLFGDLRNDCMRSPLVLTYLYHVLNTPRLECAKNKGLGTKKRRLFSRLFY